MIIKIKEKNNKFDVYSFNNKEGRIYKKNLSKDDTLEALNNDTDNIKLIEQEYLRYKEMLRSKLEMKYMIFISLVCLLLLPLFARSIKLFISYSIVFSLSAIFKYTSRKYVDEKINKEADIYNKKLLYEKNKDICKKIEKNKMSNKGYDGSLMGIYFNEDYQILREIKKYNEIIEEKNYISFDDTFYTNEKNYKRLVHKR